MSRPEFTPAQWKWHYANIAFFAVVILTIPLGTPEWRAFPVLLAAPLVSAFCLTLVSGWIWGKAGPISRKAEPHTFWLLVGVQLFLVGLLFYVGIGYGFR